MNFLILTFKEEKKSYLCAQKAAASQHSMFRTILSNEFNSLLKLNYNPQSNKASYLKVKMCINTTASKPTVDKSSSSAGSHACLTQPGDGNNLSKLKSACWDFFSFSTKRGAYTILLPGCFLNIEYKVKNNKQRPRLIPTDVKRAERIIPTQEDPQILWKTPKSEPISKPSNK